MLSLALSGCLLAHPPLTRLRELDNLSQFRKLLAYRQLDLGSKFVSFVQGK
jgi:hypothetical protein